MPLTRAPRPLAAARPAVVVALVLAEEAAVARAYPSNDGRFSIDCNDGRGAVAAHAHPFGGGTVTDSASVAPTVYVYAAAWVCGDAQVRGNARILGSAGVGDHAVLDGDAVVSENARVLERAHVGGHAHIMGHATVFGEAVVEEEARVFDQALVAGKAHVTGRSLLSGKTQTHENALVDGDARVEEGAIVAGDARVGEHAVIFGSSRNTVKSLQAWHHGGGAMPSFLVKTHLRRSRLVNRGGNPKGYPSDWGQAKPVHMSGTIHKLLLLVENRPQVPQPGGRFV